MTEDFDQTSHQVLTSSFIPANGVVVIPKSSYKAKKACPFCHSYYLTDTQCEACGKSLVYDPVGEPFSAKSFFAIKERYVEEFDVLTRFYPVFESLSSDEALAYTRKLKKRLIDLLDYFNYREAFYDEKSLFERKLFFIECQFIIDELLSYGVSGESLITLLEKKSSGVLWQELVQYTHSTANKTFVDRRNLWMRFGDLRIFNTFKVRSLVTLSVWAGALIGVSLYLNSLFLNTI